MAPDLFGELIVSGPQAGRRPRGWIWPVSVAAHVAVGALLVAVPILVSDELPVPSGVVRAFFVDPSAALAPPPPPPPMARSARPVVTRPPADAQAARLAAPVNIPDEIPDEVALDLGSDGGVPGGMAGGVVGGVVGGIVGGLPDAAPLARARRAGVDVTEPRKLREVAPAYPPLARRARIQGVVVLDCTVDTRGRVAELSVVKSANSVLDDAALDAVRQWAYTPTLVDGIPVPVRLTVTITFNLRNSA
jgi:protein TonB